jgi:PKHD-type hydroxylase
MSNKDNVYYFYEGFLSEDNCQLIFNSVTKKEEALIDENEKPREDQRISNVGFTSNPLIYDLICPLIAKANINAGWNYNITWNEPAQITEYEKGGHYTWHKDSPQVPYVSADPNYHGKYRKLSCSVVLSDPSDYEGGDLEFSIVNPNKELEILKNEKFRKKGTVIVFPSHHWHRVTPVTSGIRKSCVIWAVGPPFV